MYDLSRLSHECLGLSMMFLQSDSTELIFFLLYKVQYLFSSQKCGGYIFPSCCTLPGLIESQPLNVQLSFGNKHKMKNLKFLLCIVSDTGPLSSFPPPQWLWIQFLSPQLDETSMYFLASISFTIVNKIHPTRYLVQVWNLTLIILSLKGHSLFFFLIFIGV